MAASENANENDSERRNRSAERKGQVHTVSEETRNHEFSTVANGINGAILNNDTLVTNHQTLERSNDPPQVRLYPTEKTTCQQTDIHVHS